MSEALQLDARKKIYSAIERFPGIHFRELGRETGMRTGNLEYHLRYLEKAKLIQSHKTKGSKRFYSKELDGQELKLLGVLRQKTFRTILIKLLQDPGINHKKLVGYLGISPSSVTWYMNQLIEKNLVQPSKHGREKKYVVKNKEEIVKLLIVYQESFLDKLVDRFVETWEE